MQKSTYAYDLFVMLQRYKSNVAQNDNEIQTAKGFLAPRLFSLLLILFIGICLAGYSALFYYQLFVYPGYWLY